MGGVDFELKPRWIITDLEGRYYFPVGKGYRGTFHRAKSIKEVPYWDTEDQADYFIDSHGSWSRRKYGIFALNASQFLNTFEIIYWRDDLKTSTQTQAEYLSDETTIDDFLKHVWLKSYKGMVPKVFPYVRTIFNVPKIGKNRWADIVKIIMNDDVHKDVYISYTPPHLKKKFRR